MPKKISEETSAEDTSVALPKGAYEKEIVGVDGKKYIKVYSADGSTISITPVEEVKE